MPSNPISFKGIILKSSEYKEKDRIISVLTRDLGIVNICCKGVAGKSTKLSFVSVPYSYCDFVVSESHGFFYLKEGNVISGNSGIMSCLESMSVAGHIAMCLLETVMQSDNSSECYELAIYALYLLGIKPDEYIYVMCIFNWKLMWILGLASFSVDCVNSVGPKIKVCPRTCEILDYIGSNPIKNVFTIKLEESDLFELRSFTLEYLRVQLEREVQDPILKLDLPIIRE
ncbi:MAG: DNA repair protein RecO [Saccharofermentans sp.]|nr:DNA repair protein RecO [Saccharofermentans sp.]